MSAKAGLVVAMVGALLVHASGARGGENILEPPHSVGGQPAPAPTVQPNPPASVAPPTSVPGLSPSLEPKPAAAPAPSLTEPKMIHLQMLSTLAYSPTIQTYDEPCGYCAKAAGLTLIPIVGPWLGSREAGTPDDKGALVFGGIEAAAVAMIIIGLVGHDVPEEPEGSKVSLAPFVTPEAGGLSLRMRW